MIKFLDNDFLILREHDSISSPVACLHYQFYNSPEQILHDLETNKDKIQCIVSRASFIKNSVDFGESQYPELSEYADNIDTMDFLINLYT